MRSVRVGQKNQEQIKLIGIHRLTIIWTNLVRGGRKGEERIRERKGIRTHQAEIQAAQLDLRTQ